MTNRIKFIDISKGIAIIMIVLGHTLNHSIHLQLVGKFLYSFHVVLFFILSGYTFTLKSEEKVGSFIKKKFIRIMVPYFIWALLFLVPYILLGNKVGQSLGTNSSFDLRTQFINILYGNGNSSSLKQNSSLWFLPALFSMEIIYYFIIKYIEKFKIDNKIIIFFLVILGYISNKYLSIYLPWGLNTCLNIGFYFYIGYLLKVNNCFGKNNFICKKEMVILLCIIGVISCFFNKTDVAYIDYQYGYYILALLSGFCLSIVTIFVAYKINKNRLLEYIGRNTMGILIFHKLLILIFQTKLGRVSSLLTNSNFLVEMALCIIVVTISTICSLIVTMCIRNICPILIGEKKIKKQ